MTTHTFRSVPGLPGVEASGFGRIRGVHTTPVEVDGINIVKTHGAIYRVADLVLSAWVPKPSPGMVAQHLDPEMSWDDGVHNLAWGEPEAEPEDGI